MVGEREEGTATQKTEVAASREQKVRDCDKRVASLVQGFEILISTFKIKNIFTKKNTFSKKINNNIQYENCRK